MTRNNLPVMADPFTDGSIVATLLDAVQEEQAAKAAKSQEEKLREAVTALLGKLGGFTVQEDSLIFTGDKFVLPAQYEGKVPQAIDFLRNHVKQESMTFDISRVMNYRPYDGAHAFVEVMRQLTGTTGFGVNRMTFFGPEPPEFKSIKVGVNKHAQVPWGLVNFPMYEATFDVGFAKNEYGVVFKLTVNAPRKWRKQIEAIFGLIEQHLRESSIYRGQAINGADMEPEFIDLSLVDKDDIVYSEDVLDALNANVWAPIRFADAMRRQRVPLKRAVLFAGPFGTGKTLGAMWTAKEAVEHGWTFVMCRTGKDDPAVVMKTAELYAPAVVVVEDIDVHAGTSTRVEISRLLEMLDGVTNKGKEVIGLFTTNHLEEIQKGALRPGRIDAVIEIGGLDTPGFRKLITRKLGAEFIADDIDWAEVSKAFDGFLPAFVAEAALRSQRYTMARNEGQPGVISTKDLVNAAASLRPQLDLMEGAKEGVRGNVLDDKFREIVDGALKRTSLDSGDYSFKVADATVLNGGKH